MSLDITELAKALSVAHGMIKPVPKTASNPFFKSKYADLVNLLEELSPVLAKCGLAIAQFPVVDGLITMLMHSSGQWIKSYLQMISKDGSPQARGSTITYARRYAIQSIMLMGAEDDDGEAAEGRKNVPRETPAPTAELYTGTFKQNKIFGAICRTNFAITATPAIAEIGEAVLKKGSVPMFDLEKEIAMYTSDPLSYSTKL